MKSTPPLSYRFKTQWNAQSFPSNYEVNNQPSLTIPDQTMSISEIMDRYARGIPFDDAKTPVYNGEENEMPDLSTLDISERYDLMEENRQKIADLQDRLKTRSKRVDPLEERLKRLEASHLEESGPDNPSKGATKGLTNPISEKNPPRRATGGENDK